jgi:DNA-directed RNA polymerase II subunit RPB2
MAGQDDENWTQDVDMDADDVGDDMDRPVTQEDAWKIVTCYFEKKGLVGQQLDSFDEFIGTKIQELVDDAEPLSIVPMNQYNGATVSDSKYMIKFGQIYVSKPTMTETDHRQSPIWPSVARMRSMTYHSPIYMDVTCQECDKTTSDPLPDSPLQEYDKEHIGDVPIMLRSTYCTLADHNDRSLCEQGECVYDQGGYFIINGSEKVVVAQERMANNQVYCFKKRDHKYAWQAETRSHVESGARPTSTFFTHMYAKTKAGTTDANKMCHRIRCSMPGLKSDIPVVIIFRALGYIADRDILEHICYDFSDFELMERFRPSLEEAFVTQDQHMSLDYIGKRCPRYNVPMRERVAFAKEKLQKDMLPHIGVEPNNETKKAYYLGYIVHKLMMCSLDRRAEDDRDHFANKRMDLAGALLASQFRLLFNKMTKDIYRAVQKTVDAGKEINLSSAIKGSTSSFFAVVLASMCSRSLLLLSP